MVSSIITIDNKQAQVITFLWEPAEAIPQSLARFSFLLSSRAERTNPSAWTENKSRHNHLNEQ